MMNFLVPNVLSLTVLEFAIITTSLEALRQGGPTLSPSALRKAYLLKQVSQVCLYCSGKPRFITGKASQSTPGTGKKRKKELIWQKTGEKIFMSLHKHNKRVERHDGNQIQSHPPALPHYVVPERSNDLCVGGGHQRRAVTYAGIHLVLSINVEFSFC